MEKFSFNNPISFKFWEDRYKKNDETVQDNLHRVANYIGQTEEDKKLFYEVMNAGKFFPAGRTISNSGIGRDLTLNNCFVSAKIQDSMDDIFAKVALGAKTHQKGGGIGYDFSHLRSNGSPTSNDAIASGPVSFMDVFNAQTATILQSGRRGANMGVLSIYHPDIKEFIEAKSTNAKRLEHFNLSVMVDNDFMIAAENNKNIYLHFPVYEEDGSICKDENKWQIKKEVNAKELWDEIMKKAYDNGEPGVFFYDNMNNDNNLYYIEKIVCSNPCFTGDMRLLTVDGYKTFEELEGNSNISIINNDGNISKHNRVWCSGYKDIIKIKLSNGKHITCTPNHVFMLNDGTECEAKDLYHKHLMPKKIKKPKHNDKYVKFGFIQGDGELTRLNSTFHQGIKVNIGKNDGDIWNLFKNDKINENGYLIGYKQELINLGFDASTLPYRNFPSTYNNWNKKNKLAFLSGMFSANGCVVTNYRVQYKATNLKLIYQLQEALKEFDIISNYTINKPKFVKFSNGLYECRESYDLCINRYDSIQKFASLIGFYHEYKTEALNNLLVFRSPFVISVKSFGKEKVYDFTENINHWGIVEDVVVHNCAEYLAGTLYGENPITHEVLKSEEYGGACNLGSIILPNFVKNPFTKNAYVDYQSLQETIFTAVRMLDEVIDANHFPSPIYENYQKAFRTIGLGETGLADMLCMLNLKYNSKEALEFVDDLYSFISAQAYRASIDLAREKGPFPFIDKNKFVLSGFIQKHKNTHYWHGIIEDIQKYGIRNAKLLSVAPTGTLSLTFGNNCSSGIEPIFSLEYERKAKIGGQDEKNIQIITMKDYAYGEWEKIKDSPECIVTKDIFVTALDMSVQEHIDMLQKIAYHTDMSVSKTINVPTDYPFEYTKNIYINCWKMGIKGCTIFRPNEIRQGIFISDKEKNKNNKNNSSKEESEAIPALKRGDIILPSDDLISFKKTIRTGCGKFYLHLDFDETTGMPYETWIDCGSGGGCERNYNLITRLISLALRGGIPMEEIIDQCKSVRSCGAYRDRMHKYGDTSKGSSCPSAIGYALEELCKKIESIYISNDTDNDEEDIVTIDTKNQEEKSKIIISNYQNEENQNADVCPECGSNIEHIGGCVTCFNCGWSKCG